MKIIKLIKQKDGYTLDSSLYADYAESVRHKVEKHIYSFMINDWHYNTQDHRCLHDAKLISFTTTEFEEKESSNCKIDILLQGAYGNKISLFYTNVTSYSCKKTKTQWPSETSTHGDLLIDELLVNKNGTLTHELIFEDARIIIKFLDLTYRHEH